MMLGSPPQGEFLLGSLSGAPSSAVSTDLGLATDISVESLLTMFDYHHELDRFAPGANSTSTPALLSRPVSPIHDALIASSSSSSSSSVVTAVPTISALAEPEMDPQGETQVPLLPATLQEVDVEEQLSPWSFDELDILRDILQDDANEAAALAAAAAAAQAAVDLAEETQLAEAEQEGETLAHIEELIADEIAEQRARGNTPEGFVMGLDGNLLEETAGGDSSGKTTSVNGAVEEDGVHQAVPRRTRVQPAGDDGMYWGSSAAADQHQQRKRRRLSEDRGAQRQTVQRGPAEATE